MKKIYALFFLASFTALATAQSVQTSPAKKELSKDQIFGITSPKQDLGTNFYVKADVLVEDFEGTAIGALPDDWTTTVTLDGEGLDVNAFQTITATEANSGGYWPVPETGVNNKFAGANDDGLPCDCDFIFIGLTTPELDFSDLANPAVSFDVFHDQGFGGGDAFLEYSIDSGESWVPTATDACNDIAEMTIDENVWQSIVAPIFDLAGEPSVLVRWTWTDAGSWASGFAVDNIIIGDVADNNLSVSNSFYGDWNQEDFGAGVYDFTIVPVAQVSEALLTSILSNNGSEEVTGVGYNWSIAQNGSVIGTGASATSTVGAFCKDTVSVLSGVTPDGVVGPVETTMTVFSDIVDSDPSDDSFTATMEIDEFIYARDKGAAQAFVQPGGAYEYGNLFDIYAEAELTALEIAIAGVDAPGASINAIIYEFEGLDDDGLPILDAIDESDDVEITEEDINNVGDAIFITVPFEDGVVLEPGKTYLAVMNTSNGDVRAPVSGSNVWVSSWLQDDTGWGATSSAPMVRMNFDPAANDVSISEIATTGFTVKQNQPNPFSVETRINYNLETTNAVVLEIFDVTGKQVFVSYEGQRTAGNHSVVIDGQQFEAGMYQYTMTIGDQKITKKMIVE